MEAGQVGRADGEVEIVAQSGDEGEVETEASEVEGGSLESDQEWPGAAVAGPGRSEGGDHQTESVEAGCVWEVESGTEVA